MAVFGRPGPLPVLPVVLACAVGALLGLAARPAPDWDPRVVVKKGPVAESPTGTASTLPGESESRFSVLV